MTWVKRRGWLPDPRPEEAAELFSKGWLGFVLEGTEDYYIKGSSEVKTGDSKNIGLTRRAPKGEGGLLMRFYNLRFLVLPLLRGTLP